MITQADIDNLKGRLDEITGEECRLILSACARSLYNGEISPATANSVTNLIGKRLSYIKTQLRLAKLSKATIAFESEPGFTPIT